MRSSSVVELVVGAIVSVIAAAFVVYAYGVAGGGTVTGGYQISARFDRVDGLVVGADVRLAGVKVGSVAELELDRESYFAVATLAILPEIRLPGDTSARITSTGLLGGQYVSLEPGGGEDFMAPGEEIVVTRGSVDLMSLIGQAVFSLGGEGGGQ